MLDLTDNSDMERYYFLLICTSNVLYMFLVYERKFSERSKADFQCKSCSSSIMVIWADYGVQLDQKYPFAIQKSDSECQTTNATSVMQNKCNRKTRCLFTVRDADFLSPESNCGSNSILLVRYTCKRIPGICSSFSLLFSSMDLCITCFSAHTHFLNYLFFQLQGC